MTMRSLLATLLCLTALTSGAALGPPIAISPPTPADETGIARQPMALAASGDGFLALWSERRGRCTYLVASRIAADGAVLDPAGIVVQNMAATEARAVWTGEAWAIVWSDGVDLYGRRMSADGMLLEPRAREITSNFTLFGGPRELSVVVAGG